MTESLARRLKPSPMSDHYALNESGVIVIAS